MNDKRRARRAKQVRRDTRRAKKRNAQSATALSDFARKALARRHPLDLLSIASLLVNVAKPDPLGNDTYVDSVLGALIEVPNRETTALLAVIAELFDDDPAAQLRCREELAGRDEHLPQWIPALSQVDVYRAVRRSHVLGDADEIVLGMRIDGEHELTVVVWIDHTILSGIADVGVVPKPIAKALVRVAERSADTDVVEMSLADARAWLEDALAKPTFGQETQTWPLYRALVQWLVRRLPDGGEHRWQAMDWSEIEELCDRFFATECAAPFTDSGHRELLLELLDDERDPLRWSATRVEQAVGTAHHYDCDRIPLEVALDAPDVLRAFIPFAHVQRGIRDELTSRTLAVIDVLRPSYKREVLKEAEYWGYLDVG